MCHDDLYASDAEYSKIRIWNLECVAALSDEEHNWMVELCKCISQKKFLITNPCLRDKYKKLK